MLLTSMPHEEMLKTLEERNAGWHEMRGFAETQEVFESFKDKGTARLTTCRTQ